MSLPFSLLRAPRVPTQVTTLVLLENSRAVSSVWPDLRDHYIRIVLEALSSHTALVLETFPGYSGPGIGCGSLSLEEVSFNFDSRNVLSPADVWNAIEVLCRYSTPMTSARNLLIVAGAGSERDPWTNSGLADALAKADIRCHMVIRDADALHVLFNETMSLQAGSEQTLRLPSKVDPFVVRYSGATPTSMRGSSPTARITPMVSECPDPLPLHHKIYPIARQYESYEPLPEFPVFTHPRPSAMDTPSSSTSSTNEEPPSLVAQLQQVHGLTKKKVYGAKPVRAPFFRDEKPRRGRSAVTVSVRGGVDRTARVHVRARTSPTVTLASRPYPYAHQFHPVYNDWGGGEGGVQGLFTSSTLSSPSLSLSHTPFFETTAGYHTEDTPLTPTTPPFSAHTPPPFSVPATFATTPSPPLPLPRNGSVSSLHGWAG